MFPYWMLFTLTAVPAMLVRGSLEERNTRWGAGILAVLIALIIGLRFEVGGDWNSYLEIFEESRYVPMKAVLENRADVGFLLLNKAVAWAGLDYWAVNLICGAIFTWALFRFAFSLPNPWLAIAVAAPYFITVVAMGYTRQGVAIGLVMVALVAVANHSFAKFIFWILLAAAFHKSAMIILPIVGISYAQNRLLVLASALLFTVLGYYLFVAFLFETLVTNYVEYNYESQGAAVRILMNAVPATIFLLTMKRYPISVSARKMWRNLALLAIISLIMLVWIRSTTVVDRMALYLIPLQLFTFAWLPSIFSQDGQPDRKIVIGIVTYSALVLFVWLNYATHAEFWLPYQLWPFLQSQYA